MKLLRHDTRWLAAVIAQVTVVSIGGCSGITPDGNLKNEREEGHRTGLLQRTRR